MTDQPHKKKPAAKRATPKRKPSAKKASAKKPGPAKRAAKPKAAADQTQEYTLGEDFLSDLGEGSEQPQAGPPTEEHALEEPLPEEEIDAHEDELTQVISAQTQEWDGLEAAERQGEAEKTLVRSAATSAAAAGRKAGSAITSGFEAVGGKKITSGFQAVKKRARFPVWARFLTASFVIVLSVGTATAASLILYLDDIGNRLAHGKTLEGVEDKLSRIEAGGPQTILILGSDKRPEDKANDGFRGLSDTTMLMRIDPDRNAIALFSLPRDLKVEIPGYGTNKLNAAYAFGGPELTLRTIQNLTRTPATPEGLKVNHLVNVDFEGFARAVNAIDCVYVDVDRRYYHSNEETIDDYEEIDLQPGYQALCGFNALDYARYRHTDNDVVRAARQQDFLEEARAKVPPEKLFADRKELIDIFVEHTTSDIDNAEEMLEVLKLFIAARNAPTKEIHFEGQLGPSYVTTTQSEINQVITQFLGIQDTSGPRGSSAAPDAPVSPESAPDATGSQAAAPPKKKKNGGNEGDNGSNLTETSYGKQLAKGIRARKVKLPIYYPTVLETGTEFAQKPRVYKINGTGEGSPPNGERAAYKWVFSRPALGEYYGFQATRWKTPPILESPSETRTIGDREYELFYDGDRLKLIAWQTDEGSFWVSNTLIQSLSDREMLEIAKGMRELPPRGGN